MYVKAVLKKNSYNTSDKWCKNDMVWYNITHDLNIQISK